IYAVIRGSAVNQDGRSNGLAAPNRWSQEAVLREAYRRAGVSPGRVQYVEAHGTGTLLGDPIEARALGAVLATDRPPSRPCSIGSVKSNIGHLEAAAGIAGLIKVALSLEHRAIPASLHFEEANPHIPFDKLPLRVVRGLEALVDDSGPALAGVSSFGIGGTNAHVVLETARPPVSSEESKPDQVLLLSAKTRSGLETATANLREYLIKHPKVALADVAYTLQVSRTAFRHRRMLVCESTS